MPCQSGKTRQMIRAISMSHQRARDASSDIPIPIIISTNHSQLTIQTAVRLHSNLGDRYKVFVLNSANPFRPTHLFTSQPIVYNPPMHALNVYIERYQQTTHVGLLPPLILALSNNNQVKKIYELIESIGENAEVYFDEADITYTLYREQWSSYIPRVKAVYMITATPQRLHEYEELKETIEPFVIEHTKDFYNLYMNHLDTDAVVYHANPDPMATFDSNMFIYKTIQRNYQHFARPLRDGKYRRVIAISSMFIADHDEIASMIIEDFGFNVLTVNSLGVVLQRTTGKKEIFPVKRELSDVLASIDELPYVRNKALVIIGNRRIDRGVTFQNPGKGFLVRDIIISPSIKKDNVARMVQVLGRIAGYIKGALIDKDDKVHIFLTEANSKNDTKDDTTPETTSEKPKKKKGTKKETKTRKP